MNSIKMFLAVALLAISTSSAWAFDRSSVSVRAGVYVNPIPLIPFGGYHGYRHHSYNSYPTYGYGYGPSVSFNYSNGYVNDYSSRYIYRSSPEVIVRTVPETVYIENTTSSTPTYSNYPTPTYYGPSSSTQNNVSDPNMNSGAPLYCHNPDGYYPAVKNCPSGWRRVSQ